MAEHVVYRVALGNRAEEVVAALEASGFTPRALPGATNATSLGSVYFGTQQFVAIVVPEEQADAARERLYEWEQERGGASRYSGQFRRQLLHGFLIALGCGISWWALGTLVTGDTDAFQFGACGLVLVGTLIATMVIAQVSEARRRKREKAVGITCENCGYPLRGLVTPRCPECGTKFSERLLGSIVAEESERSA